MYQLYNPGVCAGTSGHVALELLQHFAASPQALRTVSWLPAEVAAADSTFDQMHRHVFAACGHAGFLQLWDARSVMSSAGISSTAIELGLSRMSLSQHEGAGTRSHMASDCPGSACKAIAEELRILYG